MGYGSLLINAVSTRVLSAHSLCYTVNYTSTEFLRGRVSRRTYANFLAQMYYVYEAMESELERNGQHPLIEPVHFPDQLGRLPNLRRDLAYLLGEDHWSECIRCLPGTVEYVRRIREVGQTQPELLIAHAFTRYMGDLFGGQIMKRKWRKMFAFPPDTGVMFYTFSEIENIAAFRQLIEDRVNTLDMDAALKQEQLEEVKLAFRFNNEVLTDVLAVAREDPDGFLPPIDKQQTWEEELQELREEGGETASGCVFASNSSGQCPIPSLVTLSSYGLVALATMTVAYSVARKVLRG